MRRITFVSLLLACALAATSTPAAAQTTTSSWFMGNINLLLLGRDDVQSSKFEEYRTVPKGLSMPEFVLRGNQKGMDFALVGQKVSLSDQRYTGWLQNDWVGVAFDWNQIPHSMGNHGHSIEAETAPGVWQMSATLRTALGNAVDTRLPTSTRTYDFYNALFAPTVAAANIVNLDALRQRGNFEFDLGKKLPFNLNLVYTRDLKTGYRGSGGGVVYSAVNEIVELPEALNEVTQDLGFRVAFNKAWGNVYGGYNHNWYNNLVETTVFDNPLRGTDQAYTSASGQIPALGGPASGRLVGPPDNSADYTNVGALLKFGKQTRIAADLAFGQWLQNAQLYPYTINTTILTAGGVRADSLAALDVQSLNGKIATTMMNFTFSSRPVTGLGVRARYRIYDMDNQTPGVMHTGTVGNSPDRSWSAVSSSAYTDETPFGFATANPYGSKTARFDVQASYDIRELTFEGTYRNSQIERTYREATEGAETGWSIAAILHSSDWLVFRGVYDQSRRTASGYDEATSIGLQADESERDGTRVGFDLEISPNDKVMFLASYFRYKYDFPNRPNRAAGVDGTSNGLLGMKYDTYTVEVDVTPNDRFEFGAYYTWEKDLSTTRYGGTGSSANPPYSPLMSMLTFDGTNTANTWGVNGRFVFKPDAWAFGFNARQQKVDGLMDITGDPGGSFALARAAYGGIQDITDYNDTDLTTAILQFDYTVAKALTLSFGYAYEKYVFADAYSIFGNKDHSGQFEGGNENFPASGGFYLKANDGDYKVNIGFAKLIYRW
jgi:hypothetical protein